MTLRSALCLVAVLVSPALLVGAEKASATKGGDVILPKVQFKESTLRESTEYLSAVSKRHGGESLNIVLALNPKAPEPRSLVTLALQNTSVLDALQEAASQAGCEVHGEPHALVVRDKGAGPIPPIQVAPGVDFEPRRERLENAIFPKIDFREVTPREAFDFIMVKAKQFNAPLNLELKMDEAAALVPPAPGLPGLPAGAAAAPAVAPQGIPGLAPAAPGAPVDRPRDASRITLRAENLPVIDLLRYTAAQAGLQITAEKDRLVIAPAKAKK